MRKEYLKEKAKEEAAAKEAAVKEAAAKEAVKEEGQKQYSIYSKFPLIYKMTNLRVNVTVVRFFSDKPLWHIIE